MYFVGKLIGILTKCKLHIIYITLIIVSYLFGIYSHKPEKQVVETVKIVERKVPVVSTKTNTKTEIQYIEKKNANDADVDVKIEQPKVKVKVNNQEHKFDLIQGENQKFEKGKVTLDQNSTIVFDVKIPERNELNLYTYGNNKLDYGVGVEKKNGKFHYGGEYDIKDKEYRVYARYDLLKLYTD